MPMAHLDPRCSSRAEPVAGGKVREHRAEADRHWVLTRVVSQRHSPWQGDPYRQNRSPFPAAVGERALHPPGSERA
jgi:hypothetical protein